MNSVNSLLLQAVFWLVLPKLIREEKIKVIMTILLLIFLFQFLPKVYHSICLMRRMAKVTGYIFGTIWWGFGLNLIAYFIASHVTTLSHNNSTSLYDNNCTLSMTRMVIMFYRLLGDAGTYLLYSEWLPA